MLLLAGSIGAQSDSASASGRRDALSGRVGSLAAMRDYRNMRASSEDRPGNADARPVEPGQTLVLGELEGPGEITHLWTTISTPDPNHLRNLVIRIFWDGNKFPSVESPIGDFYGLGHGKYYYFNNPVQAIGTVNGMNAFWPMPFAKSARVEVTNEGPQRVNSFYYYVDWRKYEKLPEGLGYFHAQYRQAFPNESYRPYLIMEAEGAAGHFAGVSLSIHTQVGGWWGEGDDIFTIDGETTPSLWGTGSEDYFCGAWCYGETFYRDYFGMPLRTKMTQSADNYWNVYRLHLESPIAFKKSLKVEIEHGAGGFDNIRNNGRNNDYSSVAYWYMASPQPLRGTLPPASERISVYRELPVPAGVIEPSAEKARAKEGIECMDQDLSAFAEKGKKWLNGNHVFCRYAKTGDTVEVDFETTAPMSGGAVLHMTKAPDYGIVKVMLDGKTLLDSFNGYAPKVAGETVSLGTRKLEAGKHILKVQVLGKDKRSKEAFWGIDYLRIGAKPLDFE
jgi:hypothetical protein